jgi:hypothetical protein
LGPSNEGESIIGEMDQSTAGKVDQNSGGSSSGRGRGRGRKQSGVGVAKDNVGGRKSVDSKNTQNAAEDSKMSISGETEEEPMDIDTNDGEKTPDSKTTDTNPTDNKTRGTNKITDSQAENKPHTRKSECGILVTFLSGEAARMIETLTEGEIVEKCVQKLANLFPQEVSDFMLNFKA